MYPNYLGLVCAVLALVLFAIVHRLAVALSASQKRRWFAFATVLSLPATYNAAYYLHLLPETAWFYEVRSWNGIETLVIPFGAAGALAAVLIPRRMLVVPLLATVGVTWGPFLKPVFGPLNTATLRDTWTHEVCIQSTLSSCGPASTATVLRKLGVKTQEKEVIRAVHTYIGGTEAWYLARFIRSRELAVRFVIARGGFNDSVCLPAVVGVTLDGRGHFIALTARSGDLFEVGDPMIGPEKLTREQLERRYRFTGFAMEIGK